MFGGLAGLFDNISFGGSDGGGGGPSGPRAFRRPRTFGQQFVRKYGARRDPNLNSEFQQGQIEDNQMLQKQGFQFSSPDQVVGADQSPVQQAISRRLMSKAR